MALGFAVGRELPAGQNVKDSQKMNGDMGKKLKISLIGALSVTDATGEDCTFTGRKDRAVLAFLAAHLGRPIARDRLVELIWPGAADGMGRASLRQSLSTIRKGLGRSDALAVERDTVALNPACIETDIGRLEDRRRGGLHFDFTSMAHGETFLDDLGGVSSDFDTWRATEQSRIEALASDLIEERARQSELSGDTSKAVAALSQLVALNPLNETSQRRYMRALIKSGQASAAIRQYQNLEKRLLDELDVPPEQKTRMVLAEARAAFGPKPTQGGTGLPTHRQEVDNTPDGLPTIVIHQFHDLSQEGDLHFAEGLCDSITAALSQVSGLKVITRPHSSPPGHEAADDQSHHSEGAETFSLQGNVRKIGDRLRVSARLVGATSGVVHWAEDYDRQLDDIFDVQDDITHRIVVEMRVKLSEGEKIRVLDKFTKSFDVWVRLMRADVLVNTLVEEDNLEARRLLEEAVQIDPDCAAAWGELADSYVGDYMMGRRSLPRSEYLDQAIRAAENALEAEPGFTHAHNIISLVQAFRGEFTRAVETSRKALAEAPRNPEIAANCAYALALSGHADEAKEIMQRAIDATPIPPMWYLTVDGLCLYMRSEFDLAIRRLEEAVRLVPESAFARPYLVGALMETGAAKYAAEIAAEIAKVQPDFSLSNWPGADFADAELGKRLIHQLSQAGVKR